MTAPPPDPATSLDRLGQVAGSVAQVVAPLSVLTALLFYFGYASSRARYLYFGVDVDTIGLSTQDYVMRSPEPLLTPLLVLALLAVVVAVVHERVHRRVQAALADAKSADPKVAAAGRDRLERGSRGARAVVATGDALVVVGVLLLLAFPLWGGWAYYTLVTPLLMAAGAGLALYGRRIARSLESAQQRSALVTVVLSVLLVISVFWATATFAEWSGRGAAREAARHLDRLPAVILDTTERLHLTSPGVRETTLEANEGQTFRYRYRDLRLLIQGEDRVFLVPETWDASDSTLLVIMDDSVRLQFRFLNDPP
ncbi:hypothetical protein SAMN04488107_3483 [Geodermatophilus saharensis]|uniref:Uncharacterized protein n=1 Tax=Geodermatophilus saharensis TaxID=1137994 RepID=A0A239GNY0_9ACTN|nr:hypothetical protein [Geodermatophilus saharensis]SNS70203.1 hypothetical protein SAMN04488107_3483 [Geodermatophilus saharensis]